MKDEHALALRQADQARTDFAIIEDDLEAIYARLVNLPSRGELWRAVLTGMLGGSALITAAFFFCTDICGREEIYSHGARSRLDGSADETAVLLRELNAIIENDRFPLSRRIRTLRQIRAKLPGAPPAPPPARPPTPDERDLVRAPRQGKRRRR